MDDRRMRDADRELMKARGASAKPCGPRVNGDVRSEGMEVEDVHCLALLSLGRRWLHSLCLCSVFARCYANIGCCQCYRQLGLSCRAAMLGLDKRLQAKGPSARNKTLENSFDLSTSRFLTRYDSSVLDSFQAVTLQPLVIRNEG